MGCNSKGRWKKITVGTYANLEEAIKAKEVYELSGEKLRF